MARKKLAHPDTLDADVVAESDGAAEYIEYLRDKVSLLRIALLRQARLREKFALGALNCGETLASYRLLLKMEDQLIREALKRTEWKK